MQNNSKRSLSSNLDSPLTMTVHSLPKPAAQSPRRVSGRWKMVAVMLVCAAPVLASYFTFYVVRPTAQRNYGELISPQSALPDLAAVSLDGAVSNLRALKGQWLLLSVASGACDAACEKHIYLQRQLRESLGREKDRLDRVVLVIDDAPIKPSLRPAMADAANDAYALRVPLTPLAQWLVPANGQQLPDHLYLVDPMGNWMMRFPPNLDAAKAKRDMERLMRASSSWDRAGREPAGGAK